MMARGHGHRRRYGDLAAEPRSGAHERDGGAIRWATQKEVFRGIERESFAVEMNEYDDDTHPATDLFGVDERDQERTDAILEILETYGDELYDVVLSTHAGDESLKDFVNKKHAGAPLQVRAREYQRLVLARGRVVEDIRASFEAKAA